ncbi:MAG: HD domain-containing phosphohydrolase [Candidatus Firestonebacteria bacterium]
MVKVLVADDNADTLEVYSTVITDLGYECIEACDGLDALKKITPDIDVVILDVVMPKMSGYNLLRKIRDNEQTKYIPTILITGVDGEEAVRKGIELGASDFISKPVDVGILKAKLHNILITKKYYDDIAKENMSLLDNHESKMKELQGISHMLKNANLEIIFKLNKACDYRDDETGNHIKRMSEYSKLIAEAIGLDEKESDLIKYGSTLHDIGKIGISDGILLKKGKLEVFEFEEMKKHTIIGAMILSGSTGGVIKAAEHIALTHHEKFDGSGYPKGLKEEEIPLFGRIVSVADVFDALTTKRPYKKAFPVEHALEIIKESTGKQFDPGVVKGLLLNMDKILKVKNEFEKAGCIVRDWSEIHNSDLNQYSLF